MPQSPRLSLPLLMPQQAQRHLTLNDAFRLLDVLVQTAVVSAGVAEEPPGPSAARHSRTLDDDTGTAGPIAPAVEGTIRRPPPGCPDHPVFA